MSTTTDTPARTQDEVRDRRPPEERHEQSRARYPDEEGFIERDGVRVFWESYGQGDQTVLFLPTWTLVHSRIWKVQIPYFARHFRVLTFDPRGNGRSDRPAEASAYDEREFVQDALDVMDACGVDRAICVCLSTGAQRATAACGGAPGAGGGDRLHRPLRLGQPVGRRCGCARDRLLLGTKRPLTRRGWAKYNRAYWEEGGYGDFVQWWAERMLPEPHSTKQIEDAVAWSLDTDGRRSPSACRGSLLPRPAAGSRLHSRGASSARCW